MAKVTGIGGIFFKSRANSKELAAWYAQHLGLVLEEWGGAILKWPDDPSTAQGITVWHVAENNSSWFHPSESNFMINYRVDDLHTLLEQLHREGINIIKGPITEDNGHFAWIMDPDGNKLELWQPLLVPEST